MTTLIIAEHDQKTLSAAARSTVSAAQALGDMHVLVAGQACQSVAEAAALLEGVNKVLLCDDAQFEHALAESLAERVVTLAADYSHIMAPRQHLR